MFRNLPQRATGGENRLTGAWFRLITSPGRVIHLVRDIYLVIGYERTIPFRPLAGDEGKFRGVQLLFIDRV